MRRVTEVIDELVVFERVVMAADLLERPLDRVLAEPEAIRNGACAVPARPCGHSERRDQRNDADDPEEVAATVRVRAVRKDAGPDRNRDRKPDSDHEPDQKSSDLVSLQLARLPASIAARVSERCRLFKPRTGGLP